MPPPAEARPAELAALRAECLRALALVGGVQLALFADVAAWSPVERARRVDVALAASRAGTAAAAGAAGPAGDVGELERASEALRAVLRESLARYRDPYAGYVDPSAHAAYARRRRGDLVGVGLKFRARDDEHPLVIGALGGGPLDGAGVAPGDLLVSVDGRDLAGADAATIGTWLSGEAGSTVVLGVRGADAGADGVRELTVRRRRVVLHYARAERIARADGGFVAHLRISRFGSDTHERVRELLATLERDGARGIVLDLRGNPGGSTRAARGVVSLFDDADHVYCERLAGGRTRRLPREGGRLSARPLAVLIDERSMSSAEIVAGALQLSGRATVVGAPSWGKGLIQKVYPLDPPLGGAVRITIATFSTPDGRPLHARGIVPDVYVPTAPHALFRESGSLNVSAEARAFRRELQLRDLGERRPASEVRALAALPDTQLAVAVERLDG